MREANQTRREVALQNLCAECGYPLAECGWEGNHPADLDTERADQIIDALALLDIPERRFVRWPWADIDALAGGMAPGTVHYVVGGPGIGKTTFITSAMQRWLADGRVIDVLPLELKDKTFRTYLAGQTLDIDPGYMLSGDYKRAHNAPTLREMVREEIRAQMRMTNLRVRGVTAIHLKEFSRAVEEAAARGADMLIVDHVDHIGGEVGERQPAIEIATQVNRAAVKFAERFDIPIILMSQANDNASNKGSDRLAKFAPLMDHHVWMGGIKRQVATTMLGLFRPLRLPQFGESTEEYAAARRLASAGDARPSTMLRLGMCGVSVMKNRNYGNREGNRALLTMQNGLLGEHDPLSHGV